MYKFNLSKYKSIIFYISLLSCFINLPLNAATIKVDNGFESGKFGAISGKNFGQFICSGNCPKISTSQKKNGTSSAKFVIEKSMRPYPYRTELVANGAGRTLQFGKEYWFSMDFRYEDWKKDIGGELGPFQIHTTPPDWKTCGDYKGGAKDFPAWIRVRNDEVVLNTYKGKHLWSAPIERKKWINMVVHVRISSSSDGFIEAWKDGKKIGRVDGPNTYKNHPICGKPMKPPYLKIGVYKGDWRLKNQGKGRSITSRRELWIDNFKFAEGSNGLSLVSSGSTPAPKPEVAKPAPKPEVAKPAPKPEVAKPTSVRPSNLGIKKKLVAHWLMDSATGTSVVDRSGYGHVGKLINGAKVITDEGVKFDGVDDYLNVGKLNITGSAVTVGAWFWANDLSDCEGHGCRIISKAAGVSEQDHYFMISTFKSGSKTRLRFRLKTEGNTSTLTATSGNISVDEWIHVTASYDGERMRLYKDGVEVGSKAKQGDITPDNNSSVWIGDNPPTAGSRSWKGNIANVQVFNYAMTGTEVSDLASIEISSPATNDVEAPKIFNMNVDVTDTTAVITWDTDEASDSLVGYGLTKNYGDFNDNSGLFVTTHKITLDNLELGKSYHYRVRARDAEGNETSSEDFTFTVAGTATEDNLVAHWQGDTGTKTTVFDSSGNGFVGNLKNGATLLPEEGVKLDGIDDHMDLGKLDATGDAITVGAWFWSDDLANCKKNDCRIISKATGLGEQDHYFMVSTIKVGGKTRLRFRLKTNGDTSTLIADSGDIVKDEWFHVTASYDGAKMRLYKDGVEVGSLAKSGHITANKNASAWIGDNPPHAGDRPWKGNVGDVRVYNYPMTNSEVFELVR